MTTVTIEEAQAKLPELIRQQAPGEELQITSNGATVAKLMTVPQPVPAMAGDRPRRILGGQPGSVLSMEHFDDPLEEFEEYM